MKTTNLFHNLINYNSCSVISSECYWDIVLLLLAVDWLFILTGSWGWISTGVGVVGQSGQIFLIIILSFAIPPTSSFSQDNVDLVQWSTVVLVKMSQLCKVYLPPNSTCAWRRWFSNLYAWNSSSSCIHIFCSFWQMYPRGFPLS